MDQEFPLNQDLRFEQVHGSMNGLNKEMLQKEHRNLISSNFSKSVDKFNKQGKSNGPMLKYQRSNTPEFKNTQVCLALR